MAATWDSVFIPINEDNIHWYSACINFKLKHIHIYDSLEHSCHSNRGKPVLLRKNSRVMLVEFFHLSPCFSFLTPTYRS